MTENELCEMVKQAAYEQRITELMEKVAWNPLRFLSTGASQIRNLPKVVSQLSKQYGGGTLRGLWSASRKSPELMNMMKGLGKAYLPAAGTAAAGIGGAYAGYTGLRHLAGNRQRNIMGRRS